MNITELEKSGQIIFKCLAGSQAYNLFTPASDRDYRGIFFHNKNEYIKFHTPSEQINDDKQNQIYYSLKRFFDLASVANPNILELLWMTDRVTEITTDFFEELKSNRKIFNSKKIYHTYSGYAYAQIKKAKGQEKLIHNPRIGLKPTIEDHVFLVKQHNMASEFPYRPVSIKNMDWFKQENYVVAKLENSQNTYRLYYRGKDGPGIFRNGQLVCESIPIEEEKECCGLLLWNEDAYKADLKEWNRYQEWIKNRNQSRWISQERGEIDYDAKNIMHCMRLLLCSEKALTTGDIVVEWNGSERDYLMDIRAGKFQFDEIMNTVEKKMKHLEYLYNNSDVLPHSINHKEVGDFYYYLMNKYCGGDSLWTNLKKRFLPTT